ncbi:MAG: hypothetical protein WD907_05155, partial [Bacilli bacterium]
LMIGTAKPDAGLLKVNPDMKQTAEIITPTKGEDSIAYIPQNPFNSKELTIATENKDVYVSADSGDTWRQIVKEGNAINQ